MSEGEGRDIFSSIRYVDLLLSLLYNTARKKDKIKSYLDVEAVRDYLRSIDVLYTYLLPKWKKRVEKLMSEAWNKFGEGVRLYKSGRKDDASNLFKEVVAKCDAFIDAVLDIFDKEGLLFKGRKYDFVITTLQE